MLRKTGIALWAILAFHANAAEQCTWSDVERIVAVGDVHGDYDQFFQVLQDAGLVDAKGKKWTGGKTHLFQTGDIADRGPDTRRIMDFLMRLEKRARKAGGYVHCLIGNHDAMNVYGDLRYVTPEEFAAFRTRNSERVRDALYRQEMERLRQNPPEEGLPDREEWNKEHPLGYVEHRYAYGPNGDYGPWITDHNTIIKIDDTLFVHGGISPRIAEMPLVEINDKVREELTDFSKLKDGIVTAEDGPLWYRGLAVGDESELTGHVEQVLANFGAERIVIGHTPTPGTVIPRFNGGVSLIDVGLSEHYGGRRACLLIEKGEAYTLHRGQRLELPDGNGAELVEYLRKAAALDPEPSPLLPLIEQVAGTASVALARYVDVAMTEAAVSYVL